MKNPNLIKGGTAAQFYAFSQISYFFPEQAGNADG